MGCRVSLWHRVVLTPYAKQISLCTCGNLTSIDRVGSAWPVLDEEQVDCNRTMERGRSRGGRSREERNKSFVVQNGGETESVRQLKTGLNIIQ